MDLIITVDGPALVELLDRLAEAREGGIYRLRLAVDDGQLKVKRNEGVWTPPLGAAKVGA